MLRRPSVSLTALAGYAAISFGYFGWRLLPHPGRSVLGLGHDPEISIWSFAWWPHALESLSNPFLTQALYAPTGTNLAWSPSAPGLALVFSPLTVLFGPVASYNVAALLLPALAAWSAYLLCRELTGSLWASLVGGYLFGFSTAMLRQQLLGHLNLTGVFLFPIVALVIVRFVRAELGARGLAWRLGALIAAQLWVSTEFAFTLTVALALALGLAYLLLRELRPRLRSALLPIAGAYGVGAVLAAPLVFYVLDGPVSSRFVSDRSTLLTDPLNFVVPTSVIMLGGSTFSSYAANRTAGGSAYLGLPTLLIVVAFAFRGRRLPRTWFLVAALLVASLVTLGATLQVAGHRLLTLPWWRAAAHLPVFGDVLPYRLAVFSSLAAAVLVALWTATGRGWVFSRPYVLPVLAVAALLPAVSRASYPSFHPSTHERLAFFSDGLYKGCLGHNETLAVFPFGSDSMLWQAETGFAFRLAANGLQPFPKYGTPLSAFDSDRIVWELSFADYGRPTIDRLLAFVAIHHVDRVISLANSDYPNRAQMARFGPVELIGGVLVAPACGHASLRHRNLTRYVASYRAENAASRPNIGVCQGLTFSQIPQGLIPAGPLAGARRAIVVAGQGLTCAAPPAGYTHRGFATPEMSVPADTYAYYAP